MPKCIPLLILLLLANAGCLQSKKNQCPHDCAACVGKTQAFVPGGFIADGCPPRDPILPADVTTANAHQTAEALWDEMDWYFQNAAASGPVPPRNR